MSDFGNGKLVGAAPSLIIFLAITLLSAGANSDTSIVLLTEKSPLTLEAEGGKSGGEATRFSRAVINSAGLDHELRYLPWRRAYLYASGAPNRLLYPLARTAEREAKFHWVGQLAPVHYYLVALKARDDIVVSELEDARAFRIGIVNYSALHEHLLTYRFEDLQPVNSNLQNVRKALLGRIDLFPISLGGLASVCRREQIDCNRFRPVLELADVSTGLYMAFSLGTEPDIVAAAREGHRRLIDDGTHQRIFDRRLSIIEEFQRSWIVASD